MELLNFIFRLGVVFAIYGFIWGLIEFGIKLLTTGRVRSLTEIYITKAIKYFFLVNVTFLFCIEENDSSMVIVNQIIVAGIILLTYFIGKLQNSQNRIAFLQIISNGLPKVQRPLFNFKLEVLVIGLSLGIFTTLWFYPEAAFNPLSEWFHESIMDIEDTPIFGFIFKVIGFFFLLNLINKMINSFTILLTEGINRRSNKNDDDDDFIDFEEID